MSFSKKLEVDIEIQVPPRLFHDVLSYRPHCLNTMTPDEIQNCGVQQGESKEGIVLSFDYIDDGKKKTVKDLVEKIDDENLSTTWKVIEGDILKEYKSFRLRVEASPRGSGGLVRWTLECEKKDEYTPDPHTLVEFCVQCSKNVDSHLVNAQLNSA